MLKSSFLLDRTVGPDKALLPLFVDAQYLTPTGVLSWSIEIEIFDREFFWFRTHANRDSSQLSSPRKWAKQNMSRRKPKESVSIGLLSSPIEPHSHGLRRERTCFARYAGFPGKKAAHFPRLTPAGYFVSPATQAFAVSSFAN